MGLQVGSAEKLVLAGFIRDSARPEEKQIHATFDHLRTTGEWFQPTEELLTFIEEKTEKAPILENSKIEPVIRIVTRGGTTYEQNTANIGRRAEVRTP